MGQGAPDGSEFLTEDEVATRYRGLVAPGTLRNWRNKGFRSRLREDRKKA